MAGHYMGVPHAEAEAICRRFVCLHCGAHVGDPCVSLNGRIKAYSHERRWTTASRAGLLPALIEFHD